MNLTSKSFDVKFTLFHEIRRLQRKPTHFCLCESYMKQNICKKMKNIILRAKKKHMVKRKKHGDAIKFKRGRNVSRKS